METFLGGRFVSVSEGDAPREFRRNMRKTIAAFVPSYIQEETTPVWKGQPLPFLTYLMQ